MLGDRFPQVSVLTPPLAATTVSLIVLLLVDPGDVDGGAILLMVPALFFFIPGDVLSASMYQLGAGRITVGSAQFVYSIFTLLLLNLGVVFGAVLTGTQSSDLFGEAAASDFPASRHQPRLQRMEPVDQLPQVPSRQHDRERTKQSP